REGLRAIHSVGGPIDVGTSVRVNVDFKRRLDHMQQHSGQHLLSAVLYKDHRLETVSWSLGATVSHVELKTSKDFKSSPELFCKIEDKCNIMIFDALEVRVTEFDQSSATCPSSVPEDYVDGIVRFVEIVKDGTVLDQNV
ncbi:hypothetical protein EV175_004685, partial [Coemansia sp. RSA 1933]